ncbi:MAG: glycosyltransferase family 2 protein [Candidatus Omnitrophica bacterium]|nr:glycosyltransferase family 2 protein [Candidatus Omnitrophota bacterium]
MKIPVSVIVPILNEAKNLPRCLKSVSWADEIFVVDSGSTDGSQAIAESYGAKVVQFEYNGAWPKKKNWALENLQFSHEWAFILDADEESPPDAKDEISEICAVNKRGYDGYYINRRFLFMGKWLKHAYYPNWNLRLFRHKLGRYEKLTNMPTESGDNEAHEHIVLNGKAGCLGCEILHYAFPTVDVFIEKHNRYSNWEARIALDRYLDLNSASKLRSKKVAWRRICKILFRRLPLRPFLKFLYVYVFQKGFLDGREGYYFACLHAYYEFVCICKTYELKKKLTGLKADG